jgi:protein-tyrosine phosphatase
LEQTYFFDIHCHLVPGVDDGARDMKESLAALREEYVQNVRWIICTPHMAADLGSETAEKIKASFKELVYHLKKTDFGNELELYLGCEIMYSESLLERLEIGEVWTMAGSSYILIEFFPSVSYEELYHGVRRLAAGGYIPILAHIERYRCLYKEPGRIRELQELGAYCQINASSIRGSIFNQKTAYIRKLCQLGLVHFIGTDSHGLLYRPPDIKKGGKWLTRNCNPPLKYKLLYQNGLDLLEDIII